MSRYLVIDTNGTGHLPVRDSDDGPPNHHLMGAAWAALHGGYRGTRYEGPGKDEALRKLKAMYKSEGLELPGETARDAGCGVRGWAETRHLAVLLNGPGARIPDPETRNPRYELPVCVAGSWVKEGHNLSISPDDLAAMVRNFEKRKNEQVVIDYEHASENPEVSHGGPIPAAGWIHSLGIRDSDFGSQATNPESRTPNPVLHALVEWTPEAESMIRSGQYRFFSPAIDWNYADKATGELQGATLTSGALTNHPFLEELPPIMLTDLSVVSGQLSVAQRTAGAGTGIGYLDQPLQSVSVGYGQRTTDHGQGAKMAKKLSIRKLTEGEAKGHHGVFDGDDFMGYVLADDMKDHVKSCLDDGFGNLDSLKPQTSDGAGQAGVKGHQEPDSDEKLSELLRESGYRGQETGNRKQILSGLKLASTHQLVEQREASRNLLFTECLPRNPNPDSRTPFFDMKKAKQLLLENKIDAADLLDAIEAKSMLDEAVAQGRALPKDRVFFFEIAFNNPKRFSEYIASAVPVVRLGSVGLGDAQQLPVDQEVDIETRKLMSEKRLGYGKAMKEVFRANPRLEERYRAAHRQEVKQDAPAAAREGGTAGIAQ